jgi:hypothetical protein
MLAFVMSRCAANNLHWHCRFPQLLPGLLAVVATTVVRGGWSQQRSTHAALCSSRLGSRYCSRGVDCSRASTSLCASSASWFISRVALWLSELSDMNCWEGDMNWLAQGRVTL